MSRVLSNHWLHFFVFLLLSFQLLWNLMLKLGRKNYMNTAQQPRSQGYILQILRKEHCLPFSRKLKSLQEKCRMPLQKNLVLKGEQLQTSSWMPDDDIQRFKGICYLLLSKSNYCTILITDWKRGSFPTLTLWLLESCSLALIPRGHLGIIVTESAKASLALEFVVWGLFGGLGGWDDVFG